MIVPDFIVQQAERLGYRQSISDSRVFKSKCGGILLYTQSGLAFAVQESDVGYQPLNINYPENFGKVDGK